MVVVKLIAATYSAGLTKSAARSCWRIHPSAFRWLAAVQSSQLVRDLRLALNAGKKISPAAGDRVPRVVGQVQQLLANWGCCCTVDLSKFIAKHNSASTLSDDLN